MKVVDKKNTVASSKHLEKCNHSEAQNHPFFDSLFFLPTKKEAYTRNFKTIIRLTAIIVLKNN